jgi:hypothetical protein
VPTDGLDQALIEAGLALLAADTDLVTYDGAVPNPTPAPPYCVVYSTISRPSDDPDNSADGRTRVWVARWIIHCVGANAASARAVAQRVRTQLLDARPVIAGLECGLIRMEGDAQPPRRDETTGALVMDVVQTYRLRATS